jgi:Uma2 family endonuclease
MTAILTPPATTAAPAIRSMPIRLNDRVTIPASVVDHDSFRVWARSDDYPEKFRASWIDGALWVDLDMEQLYTHNRVKSVICSVLLPLADALRLGEYLGDGMLVTLPAPVGVTTSPDGLLAFFDSFRSRRIVPVPNARGVGAVELEGVPDMVLEVVSDWSVEKDTVRLTAAYLRAGVCEYWRVDVRAGLVFEILDNGGTAWRPTQTPDGWWRSPIFGREFRLRQEPNPLGHVKYFLDMR